MTVLDCSDIFPFFAFCWVLPWASTVSFPQRVFFAANSKRMGRCRRKLLLWHLNRYRSEQTLGSGALRLGRHLAFAFWLSALWFVITSANSLALENLLFSASPWWKSSGLLSTQAIFSKQFSVCVISCPALVPEQFCEPGAALCAPSHCASPPTLP